MIRTNDTEHGNCNFKDFRDVFESDWTHLFCRFRSVIPRIRRNGTLWRLKDSIPNTIRTGEEKFFLLGVLGTVIRYVKFSNSIRNYFSLDCSLIWVVLETIVPDIWSLFFVFYFLKVPGEDCTGSIKIDIQWEDLKNLWLFRSFLFKYKTRFELSESYWT